MSLRARAIVVAMGASATLVGPACASILDLTDHENAVAAMCQCNEQLSFLGNDCEDLLTGRLAGASEATRRQWLQNFGEERCEVCENVKECFYEKPTCGTGTACTSSEECCGHDDGTGYCHLGLCRHRDPACLPSFSPCSSNEQCCGSEGGLGSCHTFLGICVEECAPSNVNCPGCCAHLSGPAFMSTGGEFFACLREEQSGFPCPALCNAGNECDVGAFCVPFQLKEGETLDPCMEGPPVEAACIDLCTLPDGVN